jgi:hypothetical protein
MGLAALVVWSLVCVGHSLHPKIPRIWDGVLDAQRASLLSNSLQALSGSHFIYDRNSERRNIVEETLDDILQKLSDESPVVEYWTRADWITLDCHRDVDEVLAKREGKLVCPKHGHVLYCDVGNEVVAPTCLFLENELPSIDRLVTCPAKTFRLLRFDGATAHSSPRPPLSMLDPEEGGSNLEIFSRVRGEVEAFPERRRRVLLFNTWSHSPKDVSRAELEDKEPSVTLPFSSWRPVEPVELSETGKTIRLKVGLLGDGRRRLRGPSKTYINLFVDSKVKSMLTSKDEVGSISVKEENET